MVLTAAQTTAFFEGATQMAIPNVTVIALQNEGIDTIGDLIDFDKTTLTQVADNLRRPGGGGAPLVLAPSPSNDCWPQPICLNTTIRLAGH
jgi:hypothetical protein